MEQKYGAEVELVPGVGGVFEITVDGRLAFSKKQTGRFPTDEEVEAVGGLSQWSGWRAGHGLGAIRSAG